VRLTAATGNEAAVEIVMIAANEDELPLVQGTDRLDATVVRAVDGDTLVANIGGVEETIRLIGVDTPETKHPTKPVECFGYEASGYTTTHLTPGQQIFIEFDSERRDHYGRYLAYVWLDQGQMLNQLLVREGYARPLTIRPNTRYAAIFDSLAAAAQAESRGLWGACL
jgi:micrococcal nuclease